MSAKGLAGSTADSLFHPPRTEPAPARRRVHAR
jgi:hypothetical protein